MPFQPIIAIIMCGSAVAITAMVSAAYYFTRRRVAPLTGAFADLEERLERIERIVASTAVEVERVGEANRFVTTLLTERTDRGRQ